MSSLTDHKGIKDTVNAIFAGGSTHPLADLARLIDGAINDARFRGLGDFDVARWVAYIITEDQKARVAEADKTAPHGNLVANPRMAHVNPAVGVVPMDYLNPPAPVIELEHLSQGMRQELLNPHPGNAARWIIDHLAPGAFDELKAMAVPTVADAGEYPKVAWDDSRPVTVSYRVPTMSATTPDPVLSAEVLGRIERDTRRANPWDNFKPEFLPFPKLDLSGIPAMPVDVKESLEAAAEQMRESMERAAKAVRKGVDDARAAEARRILAEQPHEHIYGRGSNGLCRICGAESNSRRARAKRRAIHNEQAKAARQYPQHVPSEIVTKTGIDSRGGTITRTGTVLEPADHRGMVRLVWEDSEPGHIAIEHVYGLSAPASRLHEALKAKGDGVDG
ncbi:hypothetical protein SEA_KABREEZE_61 [Arthrobacter phage Kabreeze]|uniref:Uncharacterized protein n=1 Tax=Arthrobacter phage Kabreeze TaxID=2015835 RepID=A0A286N389_9CAUD|nr:hypothetical protein SEA_KABREEZE_61 [Arthrobacter phage Kabreeze]